MDPIIFPSIDPVAFAIGPVEIRWYALAYLAGFLLGWQYCLRLVKLDPDVRPNTEDIDGIVPWVVLGVILGGRLGYVLFYNFSHYIDSPLSALRLWEGGMSFHGGFLGVVLAVFFYARHQSIPLLRLGDLVACVAPIGIFFGRLANFINAELYGRMTDVPWGVVFPNTGGIARHPSQLYEAILEGFVLLLLLAVLVRKETVRNKPGILIGVFLIFYGLSRIVVEHFREPDAHIGYFADIITMGQILSLPMILLGGGVIAYANRHARTS